MMDKIEMQQIFHLVRLQGSRQPNVHHQDSSCIYEDNFIIEITTPPTLMRVYYAPFIVHNLGLYGRRAAWITAIGSY